MSEKNKDSFIRGAVWLGLSFLLRLAAGTIAIINADSETFDLAPRQIVFSPVLIFFNCGRPGGFWFQLLLVISGVSAK